MMPRSLITLASFTPQEILSIWGHYDKEYVIEGKTYQVKMDSARYQTFVKSLKCVACGLEGTKMLLQRYPNDPPLRAHFNLYAEINDTFVLMTKDHIVPIAQGGRDHVGNYQTMCRDCNFVKGPADINLAGIRSLVEFYRANRNLTGKTM